MCVELGELLICVHSQASLSLSLVPAVDGIAFENAEVSSSLLNLSPLALWCWIERGS